MPLFHLPTRVVTGVGCIAHLGDEAAILGSHALLVCGAGAARRVGFLDRLLGSLAAAGVAASLFAEVRGEPTIELVEAGIAQLRKDGCEIVVGVGGGSAMDTAKAIAGLACLPGSVAEYFQGRPLEGAGLPLITAPTTAGSGAEVTQNAVLSDPMRQCKESIRSDDWFARVALVDPELTSSLPRSVMAATGSDALCQAVEAFVSTGASPTTDALASEAIRLIGRSLVWAYQDGTDLEARSDMLYGSLLAGIALANARLGGVHGLVHPLGIRYGIPHGTVCGMLLPHVMAYNLPWAEQKYAQVGYALGAAPGGLPVAQAARLGVLKVRQLIRRIELPTRLREFGVTEADFPLIIQEALPSASLKHNPRPLAEADLTAILAAAL
ncbi:MAG: iron-containing alcohol dehydrogenase [Ardenticatenaceae bacterium]|nr:iron-containing alcohol dehydrogenase [Ardenticatenaceae bacterium]